MTAVMMENGENRCILCGRPVERGRQVCIVCMMHARAAQDYARSLLGDGKSEDPDKASKSREMTPEEKILSYLKQNHTGREKAVCSKDLERLFSMSGRTLRAKVNHLRQGGKPVCSSQNGYYYAGCQEDINQTIRWLNDLVTGVSNARTGLMFATLIPVPGTMTITIDLSVEEA